MNYYYTGLYLPNLYYKDLHPNQYRSTLRFILSLDTYHNPDPDPRHRPSPCSIEFSYKKSPTRIETSDFIKAGLINDTFSIMNIPRVLSADALLPSSIMCTRMNYA